MELEKINKPINFFVEKIEEELDLSLNELQKICFRESAVKLVHSILNEIARD